MPIGRSLHLVVVPDPPQPRDPLLARLSPGERADARQRSGTAQRHFISGRLAAHAAIRHVLGPRMGGASPEIVTGPAGEPRVRGDGISPRVAVSISHESHMAAACAWLTATGYAAGVDLERVRQTRVAESTYAFSARERALLAHLPESPTMAGLAGWAVKEAIWKALWPHQPPSPASVEIRSLSLAPPHAAVEVNDPCLTALARAPLRVHLKIVAGPDGEYLLAVAEIGWTPQVASLALDTVHLRGPEAT